MNAKVKSLLLPFYFGSIKDDERTIIERELLTDSEILLDYLDIKRTIEHAELIPNSPSLEVWKNMRLKSASRRKLFLTLSLGAAAALVMVVTLVLFKKQLPEPVLEAPVRNEILFDSMSEPYSSSNVL